MNKYLIAGLGNPGLLYKNTRHNLGCRVIDALAKKYDLKFKDEKKFKAKVAYGKILGFDVYLLFPLTYMNESGVAIKKAVDYLKIDIKNILVVVDDADILFEEFRLKKDSTSGGHRRLQSIETHLKSQKFARLRVGIGRERQALKAYVLDRFTVQEKKKLPTIEKKAVEYIEIYLKEGLEKAANIANVRLKKNKEEKQDDTK